MENLKKLSQDKATMADLKLFFTESLHNKIIEKTLKKIDTTGYAEAMEIINKCMLDIDLLSKEKKQKKELNNFE